MPSTDASTLDRTELDSGPVPSASGLDALDLIAARAASLAERLETAGRSTVRPGSQALVEARLDAWCGAVSRGDQVGFRRRLTWDGIDLEAARTALAPASSDGARTRLGWVDTLRAVLALAQGDRPDDAVTSAVRPATEALPFEEVVAPFEALAVDRVTRRAPGGWNRLDDEAREALRRPLLLTLTTYAAQSLQLEFSLWRTQHQSGLGRLLSTVLPGDGHSLYDDFCSRLRQGGLVDFFTEYAVLARLLSTITDLWVDATAEFLQRLDADWAELQDTFGTGRPLGPVVLVQPGLSDPHRGRRSVIALTFESGVRVVYKPKDLGVDRAFDRLLGWINSRPAPVTFRRTALVVRDGYGWVEFVEHAPCRDAAATERYYRGAGALLCLLHVLGATDCHYENIIAAGEHPVAIDLETLLHHRSSDEGDRGTDAERRAVDELGRSALATGMLPVWQLGDGGSTVYDVSGLGGLDQQATDFEAAVWSHVNTDRMTLRFDRASVTPQGNVPVVEGGMAGLAGHRAQIVDGFTALYRFLAAERLSLLDVQGPLTELGSCQVRVLLRNTSVYGRLHQQLRDPRYLREGVDRSIQLEVLCRLFLNHEERPTWWPVVAAEQLAMDRPEIPFLSAPTSSADLPLETGQIVKGSFSEPSYHALLDTVAAMGEDDLARQVAFVEGSLYAHAARDTATPSLTVTPVVTSGAVDDGAVGEGVLDPDELTARALTVAETLVRQSIRGADGSAAWIAPQYLVKVGRYQFQSVGYDLYGGGAGIGLALAAAAHVTGDAELRRTAVGALQPLRTALRDDPDGMAARLGLGAAAGTGGAAYALARAGQLLDDPGLVDDAVRAAELVTPQRIADDAVLDVVSGSAGAILGLLAVEELRGGSTTLERAADAGEHLLRTRTATSAGPRSWASGDRFLTGFSHGAAGIAYALLRLADRTGETRFSEAAAEAVAYEDAMFVPSLANWRDLREEAAGGSVCSTRWCHGAPGIALARLGGLPALDTTGIRRDIDSGLQTTREFGLEGLDHLCCGNLGRAEVLLSAGRRLDRPELSQAAQRLACGLVARADAAGSFLLHPLSSQVYAPGLFQGAAGIVHTLLRLAHPDRLRSVLLWE